MLGNQRHKTMTLEDGESVVAIRDPARRRNRPWPSDSNHAGIWSQTQAYALLTSVPRPGRRAAAAAGRVRRVVDELREHGSGRAAWMKDQLAWVRGQVADLATIHWSQVQLFAAGDAVQDVHEATCYMNRPEVAIAHLERAELNIERLTGMIATGSCECCGGAR